MRNLFILIVTTLPLLSAFAKPMEEPLLPASPDEICGSDSAVEATYESYKQRASSDPISYFNPPLAVYRVTKQLHGVKTPEQIAVMFQFDDGSACIEEEGWKFSEKLMPEKGSKWLLFLKPGSEGEFNTSRGTSGRIPIGEKSASVLEVCEKVWNRTAK